jgi:ribose transport system permease protein
MAPLAIVALGATFIMTVNEFDLSIGSIVSLGGVIAALLSIQGVPIPLCFLAAVVIAAMVGIVNGLIVAKFHVLSFITTLGTGTVLDGVIYGLTKGTTVFNGIPKSFTIPGVLRIAGIPFITLVAALLYLVFHIFMAHTPAGRKLYAIGGNEEAAEIAGIRTFRYRVLAFGLTAALAGLAGALVASRVGSANTTAGQGYFLQSYAAVYIGCTVSKSGVPCVGGTLIGAAILAVLANGLTILLMPSFMQDIITGGIIILAVVIQKIGARR